MAWPAALRVCASAPDYVLAEADSLINLNRLNVALSRPRKNLMIVDSLRDRASDVRARRVRQRSDLEASLLLMVRGGDLYRGAGHCARVRAREDGSVGRGT